MSVCYFFALANFEPFSEKIYFLVVPLAAGQVYSSTSWVCHWVSQKVENVRKLKISVNIDARTLEFGMEHPWANLLWFRKNQFEGPCEEHVFAIKGPYLAISMKGGYRIHPAVWNLAWNIPGTMIRDSGRTNLKDHVRSMFWP